jgi:hypothetical protein
VSKPHTYRGKFYVSKFIICLIVKQSKLEACAVFEWRWRVGTEDKEKRMLGLGHRDIMYNWKGQMVPYTSVVHPWSSGGDLIELYCRKKWVRE